MRLFSYVSGIFVLLGMLILACGIEEPVAEIDFIGIKKSQAFETIFLMENINAPEWFITYSYDKCRGENEQRGERLTQGITAALQAWLQPVRDYKPDNNFVDSFRYVKAHEKEDDTKMEDLTIHFSCRSSNSSLWLEIPPRISIQGGGTRLTGEVMGALMHELGHALGLEDTYTRNYRKSSYGLERTVSTQPSSIMTWVYRSTTARQEFEHQDFIFTDEDLAKLGKYLSDDDKYAIEWLYRYYHEGVSRRNCYHSQYIKDPQGSGCVPKFPIIFEIQQGQEKWAIAVLQNDTSLDVNQQDDKHRTALHYAFAKGYLNLTKELLAHADIKVNIQDKSGLTPLHEAVRAGQTKIVEFLMSARQRQPFKVNLQNKDGFTPLHFAAQHGLMAITRALLKHPHIDVSITDNWNLTARKRAANKGHDDVADLLYLFELITQLANN